MIFREIGGMKTFFRILVVCICAGAALNISEVAADDYQRAKRAYDNDKYATAIKLLLPMAKTGDAKAQVLLGRIYEFPYVRDGIKKDWTKAQFWFEKAVKQDYTPAYRALGFHLVKTGKNPKRGLRILKVAAERGDAIAQWGLGRYLMSSDWGVPKDHAAARKWFLKAIEQKFSFAAFYLISLYEGDGNYIEAYKWDLIGQFLEKSKTPSRLPDIREKMTKTQIAESQRRAKVWLKAHGEKP